MIYSISLYYHSHLQRLVLSKGSFMRLASTLLVCQQKIDFVSLWLLSESAARANIALSIIRKKTWYHKPSSFTSANISGDGFKSLSFSDSSQ